MTHHLDISQLAYGKGTYTKIMYGGGIEIHSIKFIKICKCYVAYRKWCEMSKF